MNDKPNFVGALAGMLVWGGAMVVYGGGLADVATQKFFLNRTVEEVVRSVEELRKREPTFYSMTRRGFDLGLNLFYRE